MTSREKCPRCGATLQAQYLGGLCHECVANALLPEFDVEEEPNLAEPAAVSRDDRLLFPGEPMIGRYQLLRRIGEGGCGLVYEAEQTEPVRRMVALKLIKLGMDTRQVIARFEAERQALARMDHPAIARVLDAGETDTGRPYFVMELVPGTRITEFCDDHRLNTRERLDLFIQVCQAIQHAHQKGIIHRDIKPSNVLVTLHDDRPMPKFIDFGIAKAIEGRLTDATVSTLLHQFVGTPAYMSPEQAGIGGLDIDTRSDIYSLGVLLYELLTGTPPFDERELLSGGLEGMCATIRLKEPTPPSTRLRTLPNSELHRAVQHRACDPPSLVAMLQGDLDWIVMKCLEKDRTRRYETANGLAADLKRHLNHEPVVARPATTSYKLRKAWQRNRGTYSALAAVGIILLVAGIVSTWQAARAIKAERQAKADAAWARSAEREAQVLAGKEAQAREEATRRATEARLNLYAADLKLAQLAVESGDLGRAVTLLNRHRPQAGEPDLRGLEWRYLWRQTRGQELKTLTLDPGPVFDLAFSPDGRWLAAVGKETTAILDIPDWREIASLPAPGGCVQFSPDGTTLLTGDQEQVSLWDTRTWKPKGDLPGATSLAAFSPDADGVFGQIRFVGHQANGVKVQGTMVFRRIDGVRFGEASGFSLVLPGK